MLRSATARPIWLDCQRSAALLLHFCSVLTAKDLEFRFCTSTLSWQLKISNSASTLLLCLDCQRPDVPLPHYLECQRSEVPLLPCLYCQRSEVPLPHFRSALTAKNVKFRFHTSALHWLPNMWSSASALPLCIDWQKSEVPLSTLVLPGLPKMWSSASALTAKGLPPQFHCRFILCISTQFRAVLHEGLAL